MIIVTGGAGFIGSNLVKALNAENREDIIVVDDLTDGTKMKNLADCRIADYLDQDDFLQQVINDSPDLANIDVIFHQGACSDTTEWNGKFVMKNNYDYSKALFHFTQQHQIPFIYASSASVYGNNTQFAECLENENPLNMYAYSKWQFDQYIRRHQAHSASQVCGLRYFNVYGPREAHKGRMSSVAYHFNQQLIAHAVVKLFAGYGSYGNGEQQRDFIYVADVVKVNLWLWQHPDVSGIFNVGTGRAQCFNDVAKAVVAWHGKGDIQYIPFPDDLKGRYQDYTQADLTALRKAGYPHDFYTVGQGVKDYLDSLNR